MDGKIKDKIKLTDKNTMKANVIPTIDEAGYEDLEAEVRFDGDSLKYSSTDEGFRHHERASPSPFSNKDYLKFLPSEGAARSLVASSIQASVQHQKGLENEADLALIDVNLTAYDVVYEEIEAEVKFGKDVSKDSSTNRGLRHYERTSPSPFSNEEYLRILPFADSRWSSGSSSTEDLISHQRGPENETVTTSF